MGLIPGFEHDIFISYAHNDNTRLNGWVDRFVETLKDMLSLHLGEKDSLDVWYDQRAIDGSIEFNKSIKEAIEESAILICLTSPSYYQSSYCISELDTFYQKAQEEELGLLVKNQSRIINVRLFNIPNEKWESALKNKTGFKFYESKDNKSMGDALSVTSNEFTKAQRELRDSLFTLINNIKLVVSTPHVTPEPEKEKAIKPVQHVISNPEEPIKAAATGAFVKSKLNHLLWIIPVLLIMIVIAFWQSTSGVDNEGVTPQGKSINVKPVALLQDNAAIEKMLVQVNQYADSNSTAQHKVIDSVMTNFFVPDFKAIVSGLPNESGKSYLEYLTIIGKISKIKVNSFAVDKNGKITSINILQIL